MHRRIQSQPAPSLQLTLIHQKISGLTHPVIQNPARQLNPLTRHRIPENRRRLPPPQAIKKRHKIRGNTPHKVTHATTLKHPAPTAPTSNLLHIPQRNANLGKNITPKPRILRTQLDERGLTRV